MPGRAPKKQKADNEYFQKRQKINEAGAKALSRYQQACTQCGNTSNFTKIDAVTGYCEFCADKFKTYGKTDVVKKEYQEEDQFGSF